jgi:type IV pilus assembly protein PilX
MNTMTKLTFRQELYNSPRRLPKDGSYPVGLRLLNNKQGIGRMPARKQRGIVLFFTLIAMVVMSLAAVALIRSVDTSTMIAGNLAFKQASTYSGDPGIDAAISWLSNTEKTMESSGLNVMSSVDVALIPTHAFNKDGGKAGFIDQYGKACCQNKGYYSSFNPALSLTNGTGIQWNNNDSALVTSSDSSGNQIRYIIQRMCRTPNELLNLTELPTASPPKTACLVSSATLNNSGQSIPYASDICKGSGCAQVGQTALMRITAQVIGPKNTVSYIQTIVY